MTKDEPSYVKFCRAVDSPYVFELCDLASSIVWLMLFRIIGAQKLPTNPHNAPSLGYRPRKPKKYTGSIIKAVEVAGHLSVKERTNLFPNMRDYNSKLAMADIEFPKRSRETDISSPVRGLHSK